jgi:hypothetical protein
VGSLATRGSTFTDGEYDDSRLLSVPARVTDTKVSVLSSMRATLGAFRARTRREKSGGMVRMPFSRPFRRSERASPRSA